MKIKILIISLIITIFSINTVFAEFQFHINPKLGVDMGIANYNDYNTLNFNYKANLNMQIGYGFGVDSDILDNVGLLFDFGLDNNTFTTSTKYDANQQAAVKLLSSSSYLSVYTGLALNFECDNNAFFAIASGAKFGVGGDKLNLKTPIISPYVRLTFGETLVEKEFYSMSVMLDLEYQYNIFDNADYYKLFIIDNVKNYHDLSITLGLGIKFGD